MKPTEELGREHQAITVMLNVLENVCKRIESGVSVDQEDLSAMVNFLKVFADGCHHGKEEEYLFPALERAGIPRQNGPIGVMLAEHAMGRNFVKSMSNALGGGAAGQWTESAQFVQNARGYINLLTAHIQKENLVLFPMADQRLTPETQEELVKGFERVETEKVGAGVHEEFHALLGSLKQKYSSS